MRLQSNDHSTLSSVWYLRCAGYFVLLPSAKTWNTYYTYSQTYTMKSGLKSVITCTLQVKCERLFHSMHTTHTNIYGVHCSFASIVPERWVGGREEEKRVNRIKNTNIIDDRKEFHAHAATKYIASLGMWNIQAQLWNCLWYVYLCFFLHFLLFFCQFFFSIHSVL